MKKNKKLTQREISNFSLINAIRGKKQGNIEGELMLYNKDPKKRDVEARDFLNEHIDKDKKRKILPGQLVMFDYLYPDNKEELEYYDAKPCTIFFGKITTSLGSRVIGFNIHYYPPKIRYKIMDYIWETYKPFYLKFWDKPIQYEIKEFEYKYLLDRLKKAKLDFGVREYIPHLIRNVKPIPPVYWQKAVFTEGMFKKKTREQILEFWRKYKSKYS